MEYLAASHTEVWISSPVVPLIQFAHAVRPLSSTGLDLVGVGELPIADELARRLRGFDSIVSWYGSARPEFRDAIESLGVPCEFHAALPPSEYRGHATDFFAGQVGAPMGSVPRIDVRRTEPRDQIVIHPFSGGRRKNWPLENYRQLAANFSTAWTAGPEEALLEATRFDNLMDLAVWMKGAKLYIGNDSGITHLAAAIGMPVIALFGPTMPEVWAPRGGNVTVLSRNPIEDLSVEEVLSAATTKLH